MSDFGRIRAISGPDRLSWPTPPVYLRTSRLSRLWQEFLRQFRVEM